MIPASYLFKQVYSQAWEEPTVPAPVHKHITRVGLTIPFSSAIRALLSHRPNTHGHHLASYAYD